MHLGYIILYLENILYSMGNLLSRVGNVIMPWRMFPKVKDIFSCISRISSSTQECSQNERNIIVQLKTILIH
jgi:hypothetical protein